HALRRVGGDRGQRRVPRRAPAAWASHPSAARGRRGRSRAARLRRRSRRLYRGSLLHPAQRLPVADTGREPRSAERRSDRPRGRDVRGLRRLRRGRARRRALSLVLRGADRPESLAVAPTARAAPPGRHRPPGHGVTEGRLLSVLIPAVGGQGGGVLAEWLVDAGLVAGHAAHGTSIPGVAQRTGSTTYYVEIYAGDREEPPTFSLYPVPGALDVLLAPEFLEVGRAIERKGIQAEANLRGFDVGLTLGRQRAETPRPSAKRPFRAPPALAESLTVFPDALRPLVGEALTRLIDYQDEKYAALYLERLARFVGGDRDPALAEIVARQLAVWMTYEDAIRVADLKTRASRFERIRREARVKDGEVEVTDFLKPDLDEIYGVLPYRLVAPFARWAERRWPRGPPTVGQRVKTTTILGFLRLWLLA